MLQGPAKLTCRRRNGTFHRDENAMVLYTFLIAAFDSVSARGGEAPKPG
jgi:hypothetical protein